MNPTRQRILDLLVQPRTCDEVKEAIGKSQRCIHNHLKALQTSPRLVRVASWRRNSCGSPTALYQQGSAPDADPLSAIKVRRFEISPTVQHTDAVGRVTRDPFTAAFFGPAA